MNKSTAQCVLVLLAAAASLSVAAQVRFPAPQPWQAVADILTNGQATKHQDVSAEMEPLQFQAKRWQVALVVEGTDSARGTFCHAAVIAPDWLITAASCVCSAKQGKLGIEAVLEPATSTRQAERIPIASSFKYNSIWLFQDGPAAVPEVCLPPGVNLPAGVEPTTRDLALINLKASADATAEAAGEHVPAIPAAALACKSTDRRGILMMGCTQTDALLPALAENAIAAAAPNSLTLAPAPVAAMSTGTLKRAMDVSTVVLAQRTAITTSGLPYSVVAPFVLSIKSGLVDGECNKNQKILATSIKPPGKHICGQDNFERRQSRTGSPIVLDDHKAPLLLGIQSYRGYGYTSLSEAASLTSVQPDVTPSIAMTADELIRVVGSGQKSTDHWIPLHAEAAPGQPQCANVEYRQQFGGLDVWEVNKFPSTFQRAFVFRTSDPRPVARGAPKAYHRFDPPTDLALDFKQNAYSDDDSLWPNYLVPDPNNSRRPYRQGKGDPAPGYWVSFTDLEKNQTLDVTNPRRYMDGETMPYIVISRDWRDAELDLQVQLGDLVMARSLATFNGQITDSRMWGGVVAHAGADLLGGMSMRFGERLRLKPGHFDPKHGVSPAMDVLVMVFPNTSLNSYRNETEPSLNIKSQRLYEKAQGWPDLKCLVKP